MSGALADSEEPAGSEKPARDKSAARSEDAAESEKPGPPRLAVRRFSLAPGVHAAFTGRRGGNSRPPYDSLNLSAGSGDSEHAVARNRRLVAAACGLTPDRMTWMRQVHGADVGRVPDPARPAAGSRGAVTLRAAGPAPPRDAGPVRPQAAAGPATPHAVGPAPARDAADPVQPRDAGPAPPRDACFTSEPGLALGVLSADCPAVLLADPEAGIVGAAHSGRNGTALGVVPALVRAMTQAGAAPARLRAVIGPAICGGCYEVPASMRDAVAAAVPGSGCVTRAGSPGLDLRAGIARQLAAAGVRQVRIDDRCTAEDPDLYSYRRDGRTGRFAALIWLAP